MHLRYSSNMIREDLKKIIQRIVPNGQVIIDSVPKGKKGDYSTNVAFKIATEKGVEPKEVAEQIAAQIKSPIISGVTVYEPGFINLTISRDYLLSQFFAEECMLDVGRGKRVLIEYVSVNPTGPINIVNARAAAVGASLVKLLNKTGYEAIGEYYINDAGRQISLLAESVMQRIIELEGGTPQIPEDGYHGDYLIDVAKEVRDRGVHDIEAIKQYAVNYFVGKHKATLRRFGVVFDNWIHESEIYEKSYIDKTLHMLKEQNLTYSKDNALWFRATAFGDSDDRVIITSDGRYTYLLTDIAYHFDKIERKHDTLINIWGPDHHGRIKGLTGGLMALHYPKDIIKIIIVQEVKLKKDGKILSMSKRAGRFEKLEELLDQVPKDVVRFFMLMRSNSQHLDFDLDLALKESEENPVYYVQYAYARIQSIVAFAKEHQEKNAGACDLSLIKTEEEIALVKNVLKFSEILEDTARSLEPYHIAYYLVELARTFHYFYQKHRVVSDDTKLTKVRLELIKKTAETLKNGLQILGISCPERM